MIGIGWIYAVCYKIAASGRGWGRLHDFRGTSSTRTECLQRLSQLQDGGRYVLEVQGGDGPLRMLLRLQHGHIIWLEPRSLRLG